MVTSQISDNLNHWRPLCPFVSDLHINTNTSLIVALTNLKKTVLVDMHCNTVLCATFITCITCICNIDLFTFHRYCFCFCFSFGCVKTDSGDQIVKTLQTFMSVPTSVNWIRLIPRQGHSLCYNSKAVQREKEVWVIDKCETRFKQK